MSLFSDIYEDAGDVAVLDEAKRKKKPACEGSSSDNGAGLTEQKMDADAVIAWFDKADSLAKDNGWSISDRDESDEPFIVLNSDDSEDVAIIAEAYEGAMDVYAVDANTGEDVDEGVSVENVKDAETALVDLMGKYKDYVSEEGGEEDDEGGEDDDSPEED